MVKPALLTEVLSVTELVFSPAEHAPASNAAATNTQYRRRASSLLLRIWYSGLEGSQRDRNGPLELGDRDVRGGKRIGVPRLGVEQ